MIAEVEQAQALALTVGDTRAERRKASRAAGLKYYIHVCDKCGGTVFYVSGSSCTACVKARQAAAYKADPITWGNRCKSWRERNVEYLIAYRKARFENEHLLADDIGPQYRLTKEERAQVIDMIKCRLFTYAEIGSRYNVSDTTIGKIAKRNSIGVRNGSNNHG